MAKFVSFRATDGTTIYVNADHVRVFEEASPPDEDGGEGVVQLVIGWTFDAASGTGLDIGYEVVGNEAQVYQKLQH